MQGVEILIVEDDAATREGWNRDVRDFNRKNDAVVTFRPTFAVSRKEALDQLRRTRFDCAVVDLRLPDGAGEPGATEPLGNDVLNALLEEVGIPAVVYSGYESEASAAVKGSNIRVKGKRGGASAEILQEFSEQASLMSAMETTRRRIARETARLFNGSVWSRWQKRWASENDRELISGIIVRQTASHIADALAQPPAHHHPDEFYVVPSLFPGRLDTGDLVVHKGETLVVLTPRCNMANKPPSQLIFAVCTPFAAWADWKAPLLTGNSEKREKARRALRDHATQGHGIASHFLPPLNEKGPWLVDFQELRTIDSSEQPTLLKERFASIAPGFVPNLVQRYSSYVGRVGQPDISTDILAALCQR